MGDNTIARGGQYRNWKLFASFLRDTASSSLEIVSGACVASQTGMEVEAVFPGDFDAFPLTLLWFRVKWGQTEEKELVKTKQSLRGRSWKQEGTLKRPWKPLVRAMLSVQKSCSVETTAQNIEI